MFRKYYLFVLFVAFSGLEAFELPLQFYIDAPYTYTVGDSMMNIRTDEESLGLIRRHISGSVWTKRIPLYELYTAKEGIKAVAKVVESKHRYRAIFRVVDQNDQTLGRVEENWENNYFISTPTFEIYSLDDELLAIGKWNLNGGILTFTDPLDKHRTVSFVSQGKIFLGNYTISIDDPQFLERIDSGLLILTLAIASDKSFHYRLCGYQVPSVEY